MIRVLLTLVFVVALAPAAEAHRLKVFAAVAGPSVTGYAFFVGGGRARGTPWVAKDAAGGEVAAGTTDDEGRFAFAVPPTAMSDITITVDTQEGHIASATLPASRFARGGGASPQPAQAVASQPQAPVAAGPQEPDQRLAVLVDAAVQRQIEPLMEQIDQMDSRLRFTDILSGVFLILGLAGMGLWASSRRK